MTNSSNSSNEEGNTITSSSLKPKQISPALRWCFTLNNYSKLEIEQIVPKFQEYAHKWIIGIEGVEGTPHLQGFVRFKTKKRPKSIISNIRIHWEKTKGTDNENLEYCSKENNIISMHGWPKPVKILEEGSLHKWERNIIEIISQEPDDRTIHWYWSEIGNVGKTTFSKYLTIKYGAICLSGKGNDVRNGIIEYKKTNGDTPNIVLVHIPKSFNTDYLSYEGLENIKDMYFYSGKYEGGMICGNCPHVIVFANEEPDYDKCSQDRWNVHKILGQKR